MKKLIFLLILLTFSLTYGRLEANEIKDEGRLEVIEVSQLKELIKDSNTNNRRMTSEKIAVGLILSEEGIEGSLLNKEAYRALEQANENLDIEFRHIVLPSYEDNGEWIREFARHGYDMVISLNYIRDYEVRNILDDYPDLKLILNTSIESPNIATIDIRRWEGPFLAGALAATLSKTNSIGFIGDSTWKRLHQSVFEIGAKYINPDINSLATYMLDRNTGESKESIEAEVLQLKEQGANIIYHAAEDYDDSIIEIAKKEGIYTMGWGLSKEQTANDTVLASIGTGIGIAIYDLVNNFINEEFTPGINSYGIAQGVVELKGINQIHDKIGEEGLEKLELLIEKVIKGEIEL